MMLARHCLLGLPAILACTTSLSLVQVVLFEDTFDSSMDHWSSAPPNETVWHWIHSRSPCVSDVPFSGPGGTLRMGGW